MKRLRLYFILAALGFVIFLWLMARLGAAVQDYPACLATSFPCDNLPDGFTVQDMRNCCSPSWWFEQTQKLGIADAYAESWLLFFCITLIPSFFLWMTWKSIGGVKGIIADLKKIIVGLGRFGEQAKHEGLSTISKASSVSQRSSKELKAALQGRYDDLELSMIDQKEKIRGAQRRDSARSTSVKKDAVISDVERKEDQSPVVEDFYERAWEELETKTYPKGLWARLFAENEGDENKTKIAFIKARVEQLRSGEG